MAQLTINTTAAQDAKLIARFGSLANARAYAMAVLKQAFADLEAQEQATQNQIQQDATRRAIIDSWGLS